MGVRKEIAPEAAAEEASRRVALPERTARAAIRNALMAVARPLTGLYEVSVVTQYLREETEALCKFLEGKSTAAEAVGRGGQ